MTTKTSILLISPSEELCSQIESLLCEKWSGMYAIEHIKKLDDQIPKSDIALLDKQALQNNSINFLAKANFQLAPRPQILLLSSEPENEEDFKTIKWLTTDFLLKGTLTASGLHNTIRYALETSNLKRQLEHQQKRYSSLFYNSVEPAFFLDEELIITGVNDAFFETFKISKRRALNKSFLNFIDSEVKRKELKESIQNLSPEGIDMKVRFSSEMSNMNFLGHLKLSPIRESSIRDGDNDNQVTAYHGTLTNISYEERLRAVKAKLEKIAMTYRLARTMAHEIRNPLTNINLAVDQLKEETEKSESLNPYFEIIQRCTERIDGILGQLLSSSKKQAFKRIHFDVVALVKEVVEAVSDRSELEGVSLIAEYDLKEVFIDGDREKIEIAFTNLFTNALESMDKESKTIKCRVGLDANYVYVEVKDNGSGMDQRQLESLFDPFFTSKANGVGLGLTSTQTIISEHHGEIYVESEKGRGSTFSVYLPIDS